MLLSSLLLLGLVLAQQAPAQPETPPKIAGKDLSELLRRWPREYVRWIITNGERSRYESLPSEKEKLQFIEHFWARRDPTPETPDNEYRAEYFERFAYVANRFSAGKPGWSTDRGRLYLILGPPHSIEQNPVGRMGIERPSEVWTYNGLDIPAVPASIDIKLVDFKGTGEYEIVSDLDHSAPIDTIFGVAESPLMAMAMRRGRVGQVDPRTGADQFREVDSSRLAMQEFDLQQQLLDIEESPKRRLPPLDEFVEARVTFARLTVQVVAGAVYTTDGEIKVPVNLIVPYRELSARRQGDKVSYRVDYLVRLIDDEGEEAARAEDRVTLTFTQEQFQRTAGLRLAMEESLAAEPGTYTLQAIFRDSQENRVGTVEQELEIPTMGPGALSLSSIFLAGALVQSATGGSRPFQFGTVRVIPSVDGTFDSTDSLGLYLQAYGTQSEPDGKKRIKVDFFIMRDDRLYMGVPANHLFPTSEPVGITATIPLRKCTPGDYAIRVRVTDEIAGRSTERETRFTVRESSQPSP
jgi:GWxTD domain-containing protein